MPKHQHLEALRMAVSASTLRELALGVVPRPVREQARAALQPGGLHHVTVAPLSTSALAARTAALCRSIIHYLSTNRCDGDTELEAAVIAAWETARGFGFRPRPGERCGRCGAAFSAAYYPYQTSQYQCSSCWPGTFHDDDPFD